MPARKWLLLLLALLGLTACAPRTTVPTATVTPAARVEAVPFPGSVVLGRPTDTSIAISLLAESDLQAQVVYGTASGAPDRSSPVLALTGGRPFTLELTGLQADQPYSYRILFGPQLAQMTGEHGFHTRRAPGSPFVFAVEADPHNGDPRFDADLYALTLAGILAERPDFLIDLGDTFMTEKLGAHTFEEIEASFVDMRPYFGQTGPDVPLFLVNGNHEAEVGWQQPRGADSQQRVWAAQLRQDYYPGPLPGGFYRGADSPDPALGAPRDGYFAWTWGDALFIVLDPFWYTEAKPQIDDPHSSWNWTLGREQYDWLRTTLEESTAAFKFVFIHHLVGGAGDGRGGVEFAGLYEWGGANADGSYGFDRQRPGWGLPIHQLLVEHGVSIVFHGHDHVYVRQELDGIIYQELPQPNNAGAQDTRLADEYGYASGEARPGSGHLRVTVTPEQVTVEYVLTGLRNGQVEHRYVIPAP